MSSKTHLFKKHLILILRLVFIIWDIIAKTSDWHCFYRVYYLFQRLNRRVSRLIWVGDQGWTSEPLKFEVLLYILSFFWVSPSRLMTFS
jgi:hypothetical protein